MSTEKPHLDSLFEAAIAIESAAERAAFLKEKCGADEELRAQLEQLLAADEQAGSFLETPPVELVGTLLSDAAEENRAAALDAGLASAFTEGEAVVMGGAGHSVLKSLGQTIDLPRVVLRESKAEKEDPVARPRSPEMPKLKSDSRYQLQGEIARGGMGAIHKGRDNDLGRDLAIKVLLDEHKTKPEVIQRFVEEAQIGGQLQHPGIAPVYDLGQLADRRPFFSMKLVKGETLSKLLAEREDRAEDRSRFLGIFKQVCETMAYAHSRGVVHRDLKPANIMVGAFGEVQVMDWGVAKVLPTGGVADEKQVQKKHKDVSVVQTRRSTGSDAPGPVGSAGSETRMGSVMGTPAYMPPEQALGEIDQLDQRADVFGLGAILCEILTGKPPYVGEDSTAVYRLASRGKLADAFARLEACGADAELIALARECLAAERAERPRDAGVLAERVTGYLQSVETKLRETELQRASEAARVLEQKKRLRVTLVLAASVLLVLTCGIAGTSWQAHHAKLARDAEAQRAEGERQAKRAAELAQKQAEQAAIKSDQARQEAEAISTFLTEVFQSPDPARDGRTITVAETLDAAAKKLETDLADQPARRAKLQATLGRTYDALGLYPQAIALQEMVRDYHLAHSGLEHSDTLIAMSNLAIFYFDAGRLDEALKMRAEVLELQRKVLGPEHPRTIAAMHNLASSYEEAGRPDEAMKLRTEVLEFQRKVLGPEHPHTIAAMNNLAVSYYNAGRRDEALKMREEVLALSRKLLGPEHPETLGAMTGVAISYQYAGRLDEAVELLEEMLPLDRKVLGPEHRATLGAMTNLAISYKDAGRLDEAIELQEESLKIKRRVLPRSHPYLRAALLNLVACYYETGRRDEGIALGEEVLPLLRKVRGPEHPDTLNMMGNLAIFYFDAGRLDEALKMRAEVLELQRKVLGPEHPHTIAAMGNLVASYDGSGRLDEAIELQEEALEITRRVLPPRHPYLPMSIRNLATLYEKKGRKEEAEALRKELAELEGTGKNK